MDMKNKNVFIFKALTFILLFAFLSNHLIFAALLDEKATIYFNNSLKNKGELNSTAIQFSDDFIAKPSKEYSPSLAELSSVLSAASYNYDDANNYDKNIKDALVSLGFTNENIKTYNYDKEYLYMSNAVGYTFAYKTVEVDGNEYNLIFAVVRGTTLGEWYSNFAVSNRINYSNEAHFGFNAAEIKMYGNFQKFMKENNLNKDTDKNKILITGHSRGAAVANLFARRLDDSEKFCSKNNLYAYTFATPNVEKDVKNYENIFNFVYSCDFVTKLPLEDWGFKKNGTTIEFSHDSDDLIKSMEKNFYELTGEEFKDFENLNDYENAMNAFKELAPTVRDYYCSNLNKFPHITLYQYTLLMSYAMTNEKDYLTAATWAFNTSLDKSIYKPLTNFFIKDMGPNPELVFAHCPETYISLIKAYNEDNTFN